MWQLEGRGPRGIGGGLGSQSSWLHGGEDEETSPAKALAVFPVGACKSKVIENQGAEVKKNKELCGRSKEERGRELHY